jgi:hypothetical protein
MQKVRLVAAMSLALSAALISPALAQPAANATESAEAAYTRTITKRSAEIVAALALTDATKSNRVQEVLVTQYRALNAWHEQHDAELKALNKSTSSDDKEAAAKAKAKIAEVQASLKPIHDSFLAKLASDLTSEQVETVKDKMTYGKVQFTYAGFLQAVPDMTEEEKAHVLGLLKEARELAIDGGSAEEKTAIFGKYKGKINNYLSAQGHKKKAKPATEPAPKP